MTCKQCKGELPASRQVKKFCSSACRVTHWKRARRKGDVSARGRSVHTCLEFDCALPTSGSKPYCTLHVMNMPYVTRMAPDVDEYAEGPRCEY